MSQPPEGHHAPARGNTLLMAAALIFLLGIRLALLIPAVRSPENSLFPDSQGYLDLAESLRTKGTFEADPYTESVRTPGYPLFLAGLQSAFGGGAVPAIVAQVVLSVAVAGVVYQTGVLVAGRKVGWAAAFFWALNPNSIFWPFTILSETLFAFLLAVCLFVLFLALRRGSLAFHALSGVLLGGAILVRPIGIYLIPLWVAGLVLHGFRLHRWRHECLAAGVLGIAAASLVLGWSVRNLVVHHEFYFSKTQDVTLRNYILARALADARGLSRSEASQAISDTSDLAELTRQIFAESPWSIPKVIAAGVARTALGTEVKTWLGLYGLPGTSRGLLTSLLAGDLTQLRRALAGLFSSPEDLLSTLLMVWGGLYALTAWAAAMGGWLWRHARLDSTGATAHLLAALTTLYLVVAPLANGDARFRMPADPLLALLAALILAEGQAGKPLAPPGRIPRATRSGWETTG